MGRLIDADDFIKKFATAPLVQEAMRKAVNHMPTVELVRCKDCKHSSLNRKIGNAYCDLGIGLYHLDDFCSYGERREDGTN